eukprot:6559276-Alexandrium_andersonii.AAC.1
MNAVEGEVDIARHCLNEPEAACRRPLQGVLSSFGRWSAIFHFSWFAETCPDLLEVATFMASRCFGGSDLR